jgi:hypothetical protein
MLPTLENGDAHYRWWFVENLTVTFGKSLDNAVVAIRKFVLFPTD